jgi:hypothetical protein
MDFPLDPVSRCAVFCFVWRGAWCVNRRLILMKKFRNQIADCSYTMRTRLRQHWGVCKAGIVSVATRARCDRAGGPPGGDECGRSCKRTGWRGWPCACRFRGVNRTWQSSVAWLDEGGGRRRRRAGRETARRASGRRERTVQRKRVQIGPSRESGERAAAKSGHASRAA